MTPEQTGLAIAERFVSGDYTGRDNLAMHISSAIQQAIAAERERCAKFVEENYEEPFTNIVGNLSWRERGAKKLAAAIRALQKDEGE